MIGNYHEQCAQLLPHNRAALMAALKANNLDKAEVFYSGGGDSGDIDKAATFPPLPYEVLSKIPVKMQEPKHTHQDGQYGYIIEEVETNLGAALRDFAMHLVNHFHCGWENNDGGSGDVVFDVATNTCRLEHTSYYTESFVNEHFL